MHNILSQPLFYIFLVYGISFLVMSYMVIRGIRNATSITLVTTFYVLAVFGITHGITELIDWSRFILKTSGTADVGILKYLSQSFLILSFVVLLQFGVNLLTYKNENKRAFRLIPGILVVAYLVALFTFHTNDISQAGLIARHGFGFAGALLSGIALCTLANSMKALGNPRMIWGLLLCAVGFVFYAIFGGVIVTPIVGLPIQLFRAACAFVIAISSFWFLGVFKAAE